MTEQVVTFLLGEQTYCVPILSVREVRCMEEPSPAPCSRPYVRGAINLRGAIMMVIDLAGYFGLKSATQPKNIIIVESVSEDGERKQCGLIVDSVVEMPIVDMSTIQPVGAGDKSASVHNSLAGMIIIENDIVGFINLNAILKKALS